MNKGRFVLIVFGLLFILFIGLYLANATGYYHNKEKEAMLLTEEEILAFEKDIKNGKDIDIETYVKNNTNKYSNKTSDAFFNISDKICNSITGVVKFFFKEVGDVVNNS